MNGKIKIKGQLKLYMQWPVILAVLLILMDICVFRINRRAGAIASGFLAVYLLIVIFLYHHSRAIIMNELISFCDPVRAGAEKPAEGIYRSLRAAGQQGKADVDE